VALKVRGKKGGDRKGMVTKKSERSFQGKNAWSGKIRKRVKRKMNFVRETIQERN